MKDAIKTKDDKTKNDEDGTHTHKMVWKLTYWFELLLKKRVKVISRYKLLFNIVQYYLELFRTIQKKKGFLYTQTLETWK